ncbi:MAG: cobalamin B12-binding domain-containing protein [Candidatus Portnoybacteria bacterium]|nr:cobalamin B12-binding domain-containing protein [Candidatus Portnoybacteria bacterium]
MPESKKQLDCLLISPPTFYRDDKNIWKEINSNFPPLGLADMAGYVCEHGHSVKIVDCNIEAPSVESFEKYFITNFLNDFKSIKVIGLTSVTSTIKKAYEIAKICKKYYPEALIVFGGVHATFVTKEVIEHEFVDIVVVGEGEITLEEILAGKELEQIDGIVFKKQEGGEIKIITNRSRQRIMDLNAMPLPAYDLLPILKYKPAKGSYKKLPAMSMMTSRGCPGRCTFCSKTLGNVMVFKSAETIFKEIKFLVESYGIKQILFYDDTFTVFRENVIKLCDLFIENKMDLAWTCFARVDFIDFSMLEKMKKAGCHQIMYGVENIDETVLRNINKKINLEQVINATAWTKKAGIECRLAFMVGNPGDSVSAIKKNIEFVKKINPDLLIVNITTPFPGTEMFKWAHEKGLILTYDWDDYTLAKPVMKLENMSVEEIRNLYRIMFRSFYFRPRYIINKILSIRSLDDFKILFDGLKALVSFFFKKKAV